METFQDLFEAALSDIYYSEALATVFTAHHEQTEQQVVRLERIFERLGKTARGNKCPAIDGILAEGNEVMKEAKDDTVRDAGMLAAAQAVEHYEIARYGSLKAWAEKLGMTDAVELLEQTLQEEKATDKKLTDLADGEINIVVRG